MSDFRSTRAKLPPEAFAYAPGPEPEPSDPIDEKTWGSIMFLPDDVSFRTTDHHGQLLRDAHDVWGKWISLVLDIQSLIDTPRDDPLSTGALIVTDELQASVYAALTGFYRQSIAGLRSALEGIVAGVYFRSASDPGGFTQWAEGEREGQLWMKDVRKRLAVMDPFRRFEGNSGRPRTAHGASLLGHTGWLAILYGHLSGFSHGRPFHVGPFGNKLPSSNVELWGGSNGPVYEPRSVRLWATFYFDVVLLCVLLVGLADERLLTIAHPTEVPYSEYLELVRRSNAAPPPVAGEIAAYLAREA